MADLTIEYYWHCQSAERAIYHIAGSRDNSYKVEYDHNSMDRRGEGWSCTCKGFKFNGNCKHIKAAKEKHCGWLQFTDNGDAVSIHEDEDHPNGKACPKCGGEVGSRGWGV